MRTVRLIQLSGLAAVVGGTLRIVTSFVPAGPGAGIELVYLAVDLLLLLGLLGIYTDEHEHAGRTGFLGFLLATAGIASIVGPDGYLGVVPMYPAGSLVFSVGLCLLAVGVWRGRALPRVVPVLWSATAVLGVGGSLARQPALVATAGVLLGLAFALAGLRMAHRLTRDQPRPEPAGTGFGATRDSSGSALGR